MDQVKFTSMKEGDGEDYAFLARHEAEYGAGVGARLLGALKALEDSFGGYQVSRLEHSLQTATRAWRDGADDQWVVAALLHDIGDVYAPFNHDKLAAAILKPYVRGQVHWVIENHGDFQLVYYGHFVGADRNAREKFLGHPFFDDCVDFCERWDQASFDPHYDSLPLSFFEAMVASVFAVEAWDTHVLTAPAQPLVNADVARTRAGQA